MKLKSLAILAAVVGLAGCTLPNQPITNPIPGSSSITGNWELTVTSTQTPYTGDTMPIGIYLTTTGNTVSGTASISVPCPAFGCAWPTVTINRQLSGTIDADDNLVLTSTQSTNMVFTLTAKNTGKSLENGTYTLSNGGAIVDQGTVTGSWFPPLNGTYSGTVISSISGQSIGVTTTLNESTNLNSRGYLDVTGSANITGESCFNAATMTGLADSSGMVGNSFVVTLVATNNPSIFIDEFGTLSQDGKTIQFTYFVINPNGGRTCDNNDLTTGTLTLQ